MSTVICPHCQSAIQVGSVVERNLEAYGGQRLVKTSCCGKGMYVRPVITFRVSPYTGDRTEDDWGQNISNNG